MPSPIVEVDFYQELDDDAEKLGLRRADGSLTEVYIGVIVGPPGDPGIGLPPGGTVGQGLIKINSADYVAGWQDIDLSSVISSEVDRATAAEALLIPLAQKAAANGVATLDSTGLIPSEQIPSIAFVEFLGAVASEVDMLALIGQRGDWCTRTDLGTTWQVISEPSSVFGNWQEMTYPASPVSSVNGRIGAVALTYSDVGASGPFGTVSTYAIEDIVQSKNGGLETYSDLGTGGAFTCNLAVANVFKRTLNASGAATFSGATSGKACSFTLFLVQDGTGSRTVGWPASVKWSGGVPSLSVAANAIDILTFITLDGGTTWFGFPAGIGMV